MTVITTHWATRLASTTLLFASLLLLSSCTAKQETITPSWGICTSLNNAEIMKTSGYSYVEENVKRFLIPLEPDEAFEGHLDKALKSPLQIYSYNGFLPNELKVTGPETYHDEILKYCRTAFRRAKQVGSRIIVFGSGRTRHLPHDFPYTKGTEQFIALLKQMGPIAAEHGITVVIEPLNKDECNFINTVRETTNIAKAADHPNIGVLADIYHMAKENEGPESIRYAGKLLRHCHLAELKDRRMPGSNNYDFTPYIKALKAIQYQGRFSLEGRWDNFEEQLPKVIAYLNDQWVKAN